MDDVQNQDIVELTERQAEAAEKATGEAFIMTPLRQRFVDEYLKSFSGPEAARRAGYSKTSAQSASSRLLSKPQIREAISKRIAATAHATAVTTENILAEIAKVAFSDIGDAYDDSGNVKPFKEMSQAARAAIASFDETINEGGVTRRVRLSDKLAALNLLVKIKQLAAPEQVEVKGGLSLVLQQIQDADPWKPKQKMKVIDNA